MIVHRQWCLVRTHTDWTQVPRDRTDQVPRGSVPLVLHGSLQQSGEIKFIFLLLLLLRRAIIFPAGKKWFFIIKYLIPHV